MTIEPFHAEDVAAFLDLAAQENWVAGKWECDFLLSGFPLGCFTARDDAGVAAGFTTSLLHERSGWIGNLIVAKQFRGRGLGEALFRKALEALRTAGAQTVWLTASKSGTPLYEKYGFTQIDTIIRRVGIGYQRHGRHSVTACHYGLKCSALDLDSDTWGDHRKTLLDITANRGRVWQNKSGFIVLQPGEGTAQFGPFSARDQISAERLFDSAAEAVPFGAKFLADVPAANRAALRLFSRKKMVVTGSNALMYAGLKPDYRPELLYGLATMGSCG